MTRGFHVDRAGSCHGGLELGLHKVVPPQSIAIGDDGRALANVDRWFPNGLSRFGIDYLFQRLFLTGTADTDQETDLIFELVRRASFAHAPSRYASIFAAETLNDALSWRVHVEAPAAAVWEVEADDAFRADTEFLTLAGTPSDVWLRAERYWRGEETDSPRWELLLRPPVRVLRRAG